MKGISLIFRDNEISFSVSCSTPAVENTSHGMRRVSLSGIKRLLSAKSEKSVVRRTLLICLHTEVRENSLTPLIIHAKRSEGL